MVCSGGIVAVSQNRKLSEFRSEPLRRGEKCSKFSPWNKKNRSNCKLSEFLSNHTGGKKTTRNSIPWNKNTSKLSEFRSEAFRGRQHALSSLCRSRFFVKLIFPCNSVPSELRNGLFRKPRNASEWALSQNCSESIRRNFFGIKFRCNPIRVPASLYRLKPCLFYVT